MKRKDKAPEAITERKEKAEKSAVPPTPFSLGTRAKNVMNKLFSPKNEAAGSLKWDHFVKVGECNPLSLTLMLF